MYFSGGIKKPWTWKDFGKKTLVLVFFLYDLCMKLLTEGCSHSSASLSPLWWRTFNYILRELPKVPTHVPVCVLGNYRDMGEHRVILPGDVRDLIDNLNRWEVTEQGSSCSLPSPISSCLTAAFHIRVTCTLCPVPALGSQSAPCLTSSICWHHGPFDLKHIVWRALENKECLAACTFQKLFPTSPLLSG